MYEVYSKSFLWTWVKFIKRSIVQFSGRSTTLNAGLVCVDAWHGQWIKSNEKSLNISLSSGSFRDSLLYKRPATRYTFSGDNSEGEPPVPIPNTAVKPLSADGTGWETSWESRSLPEIFLSEPRTNLCPGFWFFIEKSYNTIRCLHRSYSTVGENTRPTPLNWNILIENVNNLSK